jgi:hypothetical protein
MVSGIIAVAGGPAAIACGAFGEAADPARTLEPDGGTPVPDGGGPAPPDGSAVADAANGDGGASCGATRPAALRCGGGTCATVKNEVCCVDGPIDRACMPNGSCAGTQMNCQGNADCPNGTVCCQSGTFLGSECLTKCAAGKPRYCYGSAECDAGDGCVPYPDAGYDNVWRCAPCN